MPLFIVVFQGLFELLGVGGFLAGYFMDIWWLMVVCGALIILDDVLEIAMGILNPLFPVILAVMLAIFISPWYVGIFWASAAFKILGVHTSFLKVVSPAKVLARASQKAGNQDG